MKDKLGFTGPLQTLWEYSRGKRIRKPPTCQSKSGRHTSKDHESHSGTLPFGLTSETGKGSKYKCGVMYRCSHLCATVCRNILLFNPQTRIVHFSGQANKEKCFLDWKVI